jgi:DNA mismatch repair ATPase MutS
MIDFIRRAFDSVRLTRELSAAEDTIADLTRQLKSIHQAPSFREVCTEFDASEYVPQLFDRVIDDLAPFVERDALKLLKTAFAGLGKETASRPRMYGQVAENYPDRVLEFRFELDRIGTSVRVANFR